MKCHRFTKTIFLAFCVYSTVHMFSLFYYYYVISLFIYRSHYLYNFQRQKLNTNVKRKKIAYGFYDYPLQKYVMKS